MCRESMNKARNRKHNRIVPQVFLHKGQRFRILYESYMSGHVRPLAIENCDTLLLWKDSKTHPVQSLRKLRHVLIISGRYQVSP